MAFSLTKLTIFAEIKNLGKNVLLLVFCRVWANGKKKNGKADIHHSVEKQRLLSFNLIVSINVSN